MKKNISVIIRILVSIGIIFALFKFVPYQELVIHLKNVNYGYLTAAFWVLAGGYLLCIFRWQLILKHIGLIFNFKQLFIASLCGLFFNLFFPSILASDVFRAMTLKCYDDVSYKKVAASIIVDRLSGFLAFACTAVVAFLIADHFMDTQNLSAPIVILASILLCAVFFVFSKHALKVILFFTKRNSRLCEKIIAMHSTLYLFREKPAVSFIALGLSTMIQGTLVLSFYYTAWAFHAQPSLLAFFIVVPIINALALLPITIAGLGTREGASIYFFSQLGISKSMALGISLVNFTITTIFSLIGGIFYVLVYNRWVQSHKKQPKSEDTATL